MSWAATEAAEATGLTQVMTMPSAVVPSPDAREALSASARENGKAAGDGDDEEKVEWLGSRGGDDDSAGCDVA